MDIEFEVMELVYRMRVHSPVTYRKWLIDNNKYNQKDIKYIIGLLMNYTDALEKPWSPKMQNEIVIPLINILTRYLDDELGCTIPKFEIPENLAPLSNIWANDNFEYMNNIIEHFKPEIKNKKKGQIYRLQQLYKALYDKGWVLPESISAELISDIFCTTFDILKKNDSYKFFNFQNEHFVDRPEYRLKTQFIKNIK